MIAIVPAPRRIDLHGGAPFRLAPGALVAGPAEVIATFVTDLARDGGPALVAIDDPESASVRVHLGDDLDALDVLDVRGLSPSGRDPSDERYRIRIDADGVTISAAAPEGAHRALTSLRQLIAAAERSGDDLLLDAMSIDDAPRFAWRGLSLDVVRTFWPVEQIERIIDVLSLHKLNVLHLHLTDDQGWRLEVPGWPALTTVGAAGAMHDRPGGSYSADDVARILRYAAGRFVTVVPEIDMPGHAAAAIRAHPELSATPDAGWPVTSILDPEHPTVVPFARDVLAAAAAAASGPFVHVGGDEAFGMDDEPYGRFVREARAAVRAMGKRPIGWQETARAGLDRDDVVQHWLVLDPAVEASIVDGSIDASSLAVRPEMAEMVIELVKRSRHDLDLAAHAGAWVLRSPAFHVYLDTRYAERPDDEVELDRRNRLGLRAYPRRTAADSFDWDPGVLDGIEPERIAGVEAAMWCETITTADELEFMLLPRLAGVASAGWSPQEARSWESHRAALAAHRSIWRSRDWTWFDHPLR